MPDQPDIDVGQEGEESTTIQKSLFKNRRICNPGGKNRNNQEMVARLSSRGTNKRKSARSAGRVVIACFL